MNTNWTYGQYAIYRLFLGLYLINHFICLLPWGTELFSNKGMLPSGFLSPLYSLFPNCLLLNDSPLAVCTLLCFGALSSLFLCVGKLDRYASLFCWYTLTCLFDRNPLIANPSLPYIGWLLLAHACLPLDKTDWLKVTKGVFLAGWITMAAGYSYSGYMKLTSPSWVDGTALKSVLENPLAYSNFITEFLLSLPDSMMKFLTWTALLLELFFAPLSLFRRLRPWIWLMLLLMHISLIFIIHFAELSFGMILLHFFTFNPEWIKPKQTNHPIKIFYDGSCGLCHGFVRFTLSENSFNTDFIFMPIQGKHFQELIKLNKISSVPDSIAVYDPDKKIVIYKAGAVIRILEGLGGLWRVIGCLLKVIPFSLSDFGYELFAKMRYKFYKKQDVLCPLLPQEWKPFILID